LKLFSYTIGNEIGIGVESDDNILNLTKALDIYQKATGAKQPVTVNFLQVLVELGYCSGETVRSVLEESWVKSKEKDLILQKDFHFNVPISIPSKILALGRNYIAHAKELKHVVPKEPIFFTKATSSLIPHDSDIVIPHWLDGRVDHEAELAVIIGKQGKNIPEKEAMSHVAGYTILNDITAREMQKEDIKNGRPWYRSKSLDTFCPLGPYVVPADDISDPHNLDIQFTVNGEIRQKAKTSDMISPIPQVIHYLSQYMILNPGDIISTGTPEGVSPIQDGDEIEVKISEIGTLCNRVVKEK